MKKIIIFVTILVFVSLLSADLNLYERLRELEKENSKNYIRPFVTSTGISLNSGLYHRAQVHGPLRFSFSVNANILPIPSSEKKYTAKFDDFADDVETATVFGKKGSEVVFEGHTFKMPDGFDLGLMAFFTPQLNLGLPAGNELLIRYMPTYSLPDDMGDIEFWGLGLKHSIDQYIPLFPLHWSVQGVYQKISVAEKINISSVAFNSHISKNFPLLPLTLYGGLGFENTELNVKYLYVNPFTQNEEDEEDEIKLEVSGDNSFRLTAGFRWTVLPFIFINADASLSKYNAFNIGLGFSL